ncbi:class I SAM-dependent methyltransferase [Gelidibacter sp. F2691]|nr:class I SAM-dependent methyltransferase [Gelidibacter sp. F2691]
MKKFSSEHFMSETEHTVAAHYTHGALAETISQGLANAAEKTGGHPVDLLAAVDEFHMGGRIATQALADALALSEQHHVLDIGCGLGGTARHFATSFGCKVSGIDLTPEYVDVGNQLNTQLDLDKKINLTRASATNLPFDDASFDRACMLHVGMNIADKNAVVREAARVIKADGSFAIYDVMRTGADPIAFPVAWADDDTTSFVEPIEAYTSELENAGFEIVDITNRSELALKVFNKIKTILAENGPPPLGLHIVMGANAKQKLSNMFTNVDQGIVAPVQVIARRK